MSVEGMTWSGGCPRRVSSALEGVKGVIEATASFKDKSADVKAKGKVCEADSQQSLVDALKEAGYEGKVVSVI